LLFANYCASLEAQTIWVQSQGGLAASTQIQSSTEIANAISRSGKGNLYTSWQSVLSDYSRDGLAATIYTQDITKVFQKNLSVADFLKSLAAVMK
jgi:raffinose/stachyose/melibiose transport system substrate-binding protein